MWLMTKASEKLYISRILVQVSKAKIGKVKGEKCLKNPQDSCMHDKTSFSVTDVLRLSVREGTILTEY